MTTMSQPGLVSQSVVGGIDTHLDTHTAAALTCQGVLLGTAQFPADPAGYAQLHAWLGSHGHLVSVGIEGTGAYGAGLARHLRAHGAQVVEVDRPDRSDRRQRGKSDPIDAENAARAVISGRATSTPKDRDAHVEALRNLHVARTAAIHHRADLQRRIKTLIVTAPDQLRQQLRHLAVGELIRTCLRLRPNPITTDTTAAVKTALRSMARTWQHLTEEITELDHHITGLLQTINPRLLQVHGIGAAVAAQLLITCGDNPNRIGHEAGFAMLCGAAPIPASSGKTRRHRLNRGGDRKAHSALWRIAITRMNSDQRTQTYVQRRTTEGLSKREIIRCLIRYIAREIHPILTN